MTNKYIFSIVIPAYNEENRIESAIQSIYKTLKDASFEVIIVNDGSTDNTEKIIKDNLSKYQNLKYILLPENKGKGFAVKTGFLKSEGEYILMTDADLSTPIETLFGLEKELQKYDVLIGSRLLNSDKTIYHGPISRRILRKLAKFIRKKLFNIDITDTQCGFKIFKNDAAKEIAKRMKINRYGADLEKIIIAQKLGYKIKEIPVKWIFDGENSKINIFKDSITTLKEWVKIKFNNY